MTAFSKLAVEHIGPNQWRLVWPLIYAPAKGPAIVVPAGFECDLASIPRMFWAVLSPAGPYARAAVLHDYLYVTADPRDRETRLAADRMFLQAMKDEGVGWLARKLMYRAVRQFGGPVFNRRRKPSE